MQTATREKITFGKWDVAEILESKEDIVACLEVALLEANTKFLYEMLGALARSKGMTHI